MARRHGGSGFCLGGMRPCAYEDTLGRGLECLVVRGHGARVVKELQGSGVHQYRGTEVRARGNTGHNCKMTRLYWCLAIRAHGDKGARWYGEHGGMYKGWYLGRVLRWRGATWGRWCRGTRMRPFPLGFPHGVLPEPLPPLALFPISSRTISTLQLA